jgi:hypothetical protein
MDARDRKRLAACKCEGRKSHLEARPEVVAICQAPLRRRKIGEEYAALGHVNAIGRSFACQSVRSMLGLGWW